MSESSKKSPSNLCLKFVLTIANAITLLCECVLVGIIIFLTTTDKNVLVDSFGKRIYDISFGVIIVVSLIVILITCLGALGAIRENPGLLKAYSVLMLIFLICEVASLVYPAAQIEMTSKHAETLLYESIKVYNTSEVVTNAWDAYQTTNKCCGIRRSTDPKVPSHMAFARANLTQLVPESCCHPNLNAINLKKCIGGSEYFIHKADCYAVLKKQLARSYPIIVGIGVLKIAITASALILSVMLLMSL